jgi:hypothetical protein
LRLPCKVRHLSQHAVEERWHCIRYSEPQDSDRRADIREKALHKLRGHLMPPPGATQPRRTDVNSFVSWMENTLDSHATGPKAGHVPIQRLNRTEYAASVKSLAGPERAVGPVGCKLPEPEARQARPRFALCCRTQAPADHLLFAAALPEPGSPDEFSPGLR